MKHKTYLDSHASPSHQKVKLIQLVMYLFVTETQNSSRKPWTVFLVKHKTNQENCELSS